MCQSHFFLGQESFKYCQYTYIFGYLWDAAVSVTLEAGVSLVSILQACDCGRVSKMLFALKNDNTTGSFYPRHLLYVLSMIIKSGALCTSVHLYTITICTDGRAIYMCPCMLLTIACVVAMGYKCISCCAYIYIYI